MTGEAGPTLTFDWETWVHLCTKGKLWTHPPTSNSSPWDRPPVTIVWADQSADEQLALYQALVRATARGELTMRKQMAEKLHLLGYELIPEEG